MSKTKAPIVHLNLHELCVYSILTSVAIIPAVACAAVAPERHDFVDALSVGAAQVVTVTLVPVTRQREHVVLRVDDTRVL